MYQNPTVPLAAGTGTLALTGGSPVWLVLGAFALIAAGSAIKRILPVRGGNDGLG